VFILFYLFFIKFVGGPAGIEPAISLSATSDTTVRGESLDLEIKNSSEVNDLLNLQSTFKTLMEVSQRFKAPPRNKLFKVKGQNEITCLMTNRRCARP
jgi:hypothetical protein